MLELEARDRRLVDAISAAKIAVRNAHARSRLRGESMELVIAAERLDEALAELAPHSIGE